MTENKELNFVFMQTNIAAGQVAEDYLCLIFILVTLRV